jgi:hypothetical protein
MREAVIIWFRRLLAGCGIDHNGCRRRATETDLRQRSQRLSPPGYGNRPATSITTAIAAGLRKPTCDIDHNDYRRRATGNRPATSITTAVAPVLRKPTWALITTAVAAGLPE